LKAVSSYKTAFDNVTEPLLAQEDKIFDQKMEAIKNQIDNNRA